MTKQLTQQEFERLSPSARDQYLQDVASSNTPQDAWLLGFMQDFVARQAASQQADQMGEKNVKDLSDAKGVQFIEGLKPSGENYPGHSHAQMTKYVNDNLDTQQIVGVSDAYHKLHLDFKDFADQLTEAVNKSKGAWEGNAGENARGYFANLAKWADTNGDNAKLASETMYQQSDAAGRAKNGMPEEVPFNWQSEIDKWKQNPFDFAGNIKETLETYKANKQAHADAAQVMTTYDNELYEAASKQPVFAEPPKFNAAGSGGDDGGFDGNQIDGKYRLPDENGGNGGTGSSGYGGGMPGGGGSMPGGGGNDGGGSTPSGPGSQTGSGTVPVGTAPAGYRPPAGMPTGGPPPSTSGMPMGAMPMGPMGGMAMSGPENYQSKIGRGGFGPGGGAGMPGGGGSASGAASGVAKPGGVGAAEAAAGRGMGAGGRGPGGMGAGMGGMGGAGRGGQGSEDEEHTRPAFLVEGDPDEIFGTDQRTAPPVIGE
ncbi:hypothetical protein [Amycolatopsis suaedae]|uniref:PPE domain-containing protein n=1 Tax=Amycolatopsis suaedae TaxID=2510978 RepID=A0A4Q7J3F7_9PSEU|nr:hypothetical protein [Amycolatopsis suaedae]RZQ62031.1 hypothetical protein EWH70_20785 [Amycolatopsis suaedae]